MPIAIYACQIGVFMETTIDRFGRVVIPKKIRDDYSLEPGTQVRIEGESGVILLKPVRWEQHLRLKEGVLVYSGASVGDLDSAVSRHRKERANSVGKLK